MTLRDTIKIEDLLQLLKMIHTMLENYIQQILSFRRSKKIVRQIVQKNLIFKEIIVLIGASKTVNNSDLLPLNMEPRKSGETNSKLI